MRPARSVADAAETEESGGRSVEPPPAGRDQRSRGDPGLRPLSSHRGRCVPRVPPEPPCVRTL